MPTLSFYLSINHAEDGAPAMATLFDADDVHESVPIAEGEGETADVAVADLLSKITFDTKD